MEDNAFEGHPQGVPPGHNSMDSAYELQKELLQRRKEWQALREQALAAGAAVPPLSEDTTYQRLVEEMKNNLEAFRANRQARTQEASELEEHMRRFAPEQGSVLDSIDTEAIRSLPVYVRNMVSQKIDQVAAEITEERGPSAELTAIAARLKELFQRD